MEIRCVSNRGSYLLTALLAAAAGGLVVTLITHSVPRMMSQIMAGMMENMRIQMEAAGCEPEKM